LSAVLRLVRFAIFFVLLVGVLVFIVLPALISPLLTQYVRDQGVEAEQLTVSVDFFDPALLWGRVGHLHVVASGVQVGKASVGSLDLTLGNVSLFDRTFETLSGTLTDVTVTASGLSAQATRVDVAGPAEAASATGQFDSQQSADLVRAAAQRASIPLDDAQLVDGGLRLVIAGVSMTAGIGVEGGALVLRPPVGDPILLLQPAPSDPWRLDEAYVTATGITVRGTVDSTRFAPGMTNQP
jgi:hypothetical protein